MSIPGYDLAHHVQAPPPSRDELRADREHAERRVEQLLEEREGLRATIDDLEADNHRLNIRVADLLVELADLRIELESQRLVARDLVLANGNLSSELVQAERVADLAALVATADRLGAVS